MSDKEPIAIHKYPNRRFYDTVRSRHVTLEEIHDLIVSGKDVTVTDTKTGEDLTNVVLMQILLERDHLKLDLFPSSIIHLMIRSSRNTLRSTLERFFGPFLGIMAATQKQFDSYLRDTMKGQMITPFDWTKSIFPGYAGSKDAEAADESSKKAATATSVDEASELDDLREELERLRGRVLSLDARKGSKPRKKKPARKPQKRK